MEPLNGTGVDYPTIELGGITYTVKFTRGAMLYRLSKLGADFTSPDKAKSFANIVDGLHAALMGQFAGTPEDLSQLILDEGKVQGAADAIAAGLKKVSPPAQLPLQEKAGIPANEATKTVQ